MKSRSFVFLLIAIFSFSSYALEEGIFHRSKRQSSITLSPSSFDTVQTFLNARSAGDTFSVAIEPGDYGDRALMSNARVNATFYGVQPFETVSNLTFAFSNAYAVNFRNIRMGLSSSANNILQFFATNHVAFDSFVLYDSYCEIEPIFLDNSVSLSISNSSFRGVLTNAGMIRVLNGDAFKIKVENSTFLSNVGTSAFIMDAGGPKIQSEFIGNRFDNNQMDSIILQQMPLISQILNCTFTNTIGINKGIAIETEGDLEIANSFFINNTAGRYDGGAIMLKGQLNITDSYFAHNSAYAGGAISKKGTAGVSIIRSTFHNNTASHRGGAIAISSVILGDVIHSVFTNNKAGSHGGAFGENSLNATNCLFENNSAGGDGGVFYVNQNPFPLVIRDSRFVGNSAKRVGSAASLTESELISVNNTYDNNYFRSPPYSCTLYLWDSSFAILQDKFLRSSGASILAEGGADKIQAKVDNSTFLEDSSSYIGVQAKSFQSRNNRYQFRSSDDSSPASISAIGSFSSENDVFDGPSLFLFETKVFSSPSFIVNATFRDTVQVTLYVDSTIVRSTFTRVQNVALKGEHQFLFDECKFEECGPYSAITVEGALNMTRSVFNNNFGSLNLLGDVGSFLTVLENCTFSNNVGKYQCGALNSYSLAPILIKNCNFINNSGLYSGGAVGGFFGNLTLEDSNFISNVAINGSGGAIWVFFGNVTIKNSMFKDNSAVEGGAIAVSGGMTIISSAFFNNSALETGGALSMNKTMYGDEGDSDEMEALFPNSMLIQSSQFEKNTAGIGSVLYLHINGTVQLKNSQVDQSQSFCASTRLGFLEASDNSRPGSELLCCDLENSLVVLVDDPMKEVYYCAFMLATDPPTTEAPIPSESDDSILTRFFVLFNFDGEVDYKSVQEQLFQLSDHPFIQLEMEEFLSDKRHTERTGIVTFRGIPNDTYIGSNTLAERLEDGEFSSFHLNFTTFISFALPLGNECPSRDPNACSGKSNGKCVDDNLDGSGFCECSNGFSGSQCQISIPGTQLLIDPTEEKPKLSGGAIAGIVIGIIVFLALVALIAFLLLRRKQKKDEEEEMGVSMGPSQADPATRIISGLH